MVRIELDLHFRRVRIPTGIVVRTQVFVACTGGFCRLQATSGEFDSYFAPEAITTHHQLQIVNTTSAAVTPTLKLNTERAGRKQSVESTLGQVGSSRSTTEGASWDYEERPVVAMRPSPQVVEWSSDMPAGAKVFRHFQEGTLPLWAQWRSASPPAACQLESEAMPSDRRFFDGRGRELSLLKSLALLAKLVLAGVKLPALDAVRHEVRIDVA